jgi:hypothetical protein
VIIDDLDDPRERGPGSTSDVCEKAGIFQFCKDEFAANYQGCSSVVGFVSW